jgi:hypothetical protein
VIDGFVIIDAIVAMGGGVGVCMVGMLVAAVRVTERRMWRMVSRRAVCDFEVRAAGKGLCLQRQPRGLRCCVASNRGKLRI